MSAPALQKAWWAFWIISFSPLSKREEDHRARWEKILCFSRKICSKYVLTPPSKSNIKGGVVNEWNHSQSDKDDDAIFTKVARAFYTVYILTCCVAQKRKRLLSKHTTHNLFTSSCCFRIFWEKRGESLTYPAENVNMDFVSWRQTSRPFFLPASSHQESETTTTTIALFSFRSWLQHIL